MTELFGKVVLLSAYGTLCFPVIMLFRVLVRQYSRKYSYYAWFVLFVSMSLPFRIVIPVKVAKTALVADMLQTGYQIQFAKNPYMSYAAQRATTIGIKEIAVCVWFIVAMILLLKNVYSYMWLKKRLRGAKCVRDNLYETDYAVSPFLFGIVSPKIYFPADFSSQNELILRHEKAHIRHKDYIWLPYVTVLACIHWFNPVVWLGRHVFKADMEMFCDEVVLKDCTQECKQEYARMLLSIQATGSKAFVTGFNLQKNYLKERIVQIMTKKQIKCSIGVMGALVIMAGVLFTLPKVRIQAETPEIPEEATENPVLETVADSPEIITLEAEEATKDTNGASDPSDVFEAIFPLKVEYVISAPYAAEPNLLWGGTHDGIDFAAPKGSEVCAVSDGMVSDCGYNTRDGYFIVLAHGEHYKTYYKHCNELFVTQGQTVAQGDTIATVGSTGYATGPHLHFGVSFDDVMIDAKDMLEGFME